MTLISTTSASKGIKLTVRRVAAEQLSPFPLALDEFQSQLRCPTFDRADRRLDRLQLELKMRKLGLVMLVRRSRRLGVAGIRRRLVLCRSLLRFRRRFR